MARAFTSREKMLVEHLARSYPQIRAATHLITGVDGARIEALCLALHGSDRHIHIERDRIASGLASPEDLASSIEVNLGIGRQLSSNVPATT